jgi:integrase
MPRVEILKKLNLFTPSTVGLLCDDELTISIHGKGHNYYKYEDDSFFLTNFHHYPVIIDDDGTQWVEANRYLLNRLKCFNTVSHRTLESIAYDLANFRKWQVDEEVDFLRITPRPRARPTYRYVAYLHGEVRLGKIKASTAKRRVSTMQGLYRWLADDVGGFLHDLWEENEVSVRFKSDYGSSHTKSITSTDLTRSFKVSRSSDDYGDYINDGGKLRPLPQEEQISVLKALQAIGNTEMTLSFLLALTTGARLQTVFTLREQNFDQDENRNTNFYRINVGGRTLVDTKYDKEIVLHIPKWLYLRVKIYLNSNRYNHRTSISKAKTEDNSQQYVFLTRTGQPYYMAKSDSSKFSYNSPPRGNAITQFIRQQLKPKLIEMGCDFEIRFHDLRASFGMNLLESRLGSLENREASLTPNKPDFLTVLTYIQARMGHSQVRTTEAYLNYREKHEVAIHVQSEFESYLEELITNEGGDNHALDS